MNNNTPEHYNMIYLNNPNRWNDINDIMANTNFEDGYFDIVMSIGSFEHLNPNAWISKIEESGFKVDNNVIHKWIFTGVPI